MAAFSIATILGAPAAAASVPVNNAAQTNNVLSAPVTNTGQSFVDAKDTNCIAKFHRAALQKIGNLIGKGVWGSVFQAMDSQGNYYALKIGQKYTEKTLIANVPDREVATLSALNKAGADWVPKLYAAWECKCSSITMSPKDDHTCQFQLMQLFDQDLAKYTNRYLLDRRSFVRMFRFAITLGMHGYIHGDLKPDQFLVNVDPKYKHKITQMALSDFGFSSNILYPVFKEVIAGFTSNHDVWNFPQFKPPDATKVTAIDLQIWAVFINIQQLFSALLLTLTNVYVELGADQKTEEISIVHSISIDGLETVFWNLVDPNERKSIETFVKKQTPEAVKSVAARFTSHKNKFDVSIDIKNLLPIELVQYIETKMQTPVAATAAS
jgi:serine/threonine protein kinase